MLDHLKKTSRLKLGLLALGMQSLKRGLDWEHSAVERDTDAMHAALHGESAETAEPEGIEMAGDIFLGDITMSSPEPPKPAVSQAKKLSTAAIVAAALVGSGLGVVGSKYLESPTPPAATSVDTVSTLEIDR